VGETADHKIETNIVQLHTAPRSVPDFLRAAASELEKDAGENLRCVLVVVNDDESKFRLRLERFGITTLEAIGALHTSAHDLLG